MYKTTTFFLSLFIALMLFSCSQDDGLSCNYSNDDALSEEMGATSRAAITSDPGIKKLIVILWDGSGKDGKIKTAFSDGWQDAECHTPYHKKYIDDRFKSPGQTKSDIETMVSQSGYSKSELGLLVIGKSMGGAKTYKMIHDYQTTFDDFKKVHVVLIDAHEGPQPGNQGYSGKWYDYVHFDNNTKYITRDYDLTYTSRYYNYGSKLRVYNTYQRDDLLEGYTFRKAYRNKKQSISRDGHSKITNTATTVDLIEEAIEDICMSTFQKEVRALAESNTYFRLKNRWTGEYLHNQNNNGKLQVGTLGAPGWWSAQWKFEKGTDGYYRLKNRWKGTYMHNQYDRGYVEVSALGHMSWWAAQWDIKEIDNNYILLDNKWKPNQFINTQLQLDHATCHNTNASHIGWWSVQWILEKI